MGTFTGVVYNPPSAEFPHLAVMFNTADMSKTLMAVPVSSISAGEKLIEHLGEEFLKKWEDLERS